MTYTGYLADGTMFDASASHAITANGFAFRLDDDYAANQPFMNMALSKDFNYGGVDGDVIAGWEYGLQGIKPGEKRTLIMSAAAAYGSTGTQGIPANSTLRFDVQCISIAFKASLGLVADDANGNPIAYVNPNQTTISAAAGTLLTVPSGQTSASAKFSLFSVFSDNANGTPLANITTSNINFSGTAANDFSIIRTGNLLTLTFHPTATGARNATVHIHSSDPAHSDFTFAVQGTSQTSLSLVKTT